MNTLSASETVGAGEGSGTRKRPLSGGLLGVDGSSFHLPGSESLSAFAGITRLLLLSSLGQKSESMMVETLELLKLDWRCNSMDTFCFSESEDLLDDRLDSAILNVMNDTKVFTECIRRAQTMWK